MNTALLRHKLSCARHEILRILNCRTLSTHILGRRKHAKRLNNPLRVLDIISAKRRTTSPNQNHLRLIQDFLQTGYDHTVEKNLNDDFGIPRLENEVPNAFGEVLKSFGVDKEDSDGRLLDASVLSNAVSLCGSKRDLRGGSQYHSHAIRSGFVVNSYVGSSLITFYIRCGELQNGYKVFEEMPLRNVVSWTAIISGFAKDWQVDMCFELYSFMRNSTLKPNEFTFTSILSACTGTGALGQGRSAHCQIVQMGFDSHLYIANALISMYCKCGNVDDALEIFEIMVSKDIVSWNSMIAGYAQHGLAVQALELFEEMKKLGIKPDGITFLGVLSSCRHAGLVDGGRNYFNSMAEYGVRPELDHYSCLIDLLGRAGLVEEARDIVLSMPMSPNAVIWGSLLSSCRLHGSVWIGIQAAESKLLLEPGCAATHVQLANLYASVKCWDQAARVRKLMKDRSLKTIPGYSWIEIKNVVYRFRAEDWSNSRLNEIVILLDRLMDHIAISELVPGIEEEVDVVLYRVMRVHKFSAPSSLHLTSC